MKDYNELIKTQKQKIEEFVKSPFYTELLTQDEMAKVLQVPSEDMQLFKFIIDELLNEGKLVLTKKLRLATPERAGFFTGVLRTSENGKGFVSVEGIEDRILVSKGDLNGAAHMDTVLISVSMVKGKPCGVVKKVLKRNFDSVVGTYEIREGTGFVIPDDRKLFKRVEITGRAKPDLEGYKVVAKLTAPPDKKRVPKGKITEVLGLKGEKGVDMLSVMAEKEIPSDFPSKVKEEAARISSEPIETDFEDREDFRSVQMVTIDGEDAKDLDDAVSCKRLENGNFELGVYIADVSHYVRENSHLDKEALKRGTSTYLPDRVIPMLPQELSNGICSLNQGQNRLALCCIMEIDQSGRVTSHRTVKGIINVDRRMTYTVVNDLVENPESEYAEEYRDFLPMFMLMKELKAILFEKRLKRGAIDFSFAETQIILDDNGKAVDIVERRRNTASAIIEEFMIAANETVAEEFYFLKVPFLYRSHEVPDEEKYEILSKTVGKFGYLLKGNRKSPKGMQKLLDDVKGKPEEMPVNMLALRSMQQARYTGEELGHYGLGAKFYCHFTSPIRRYPDLFIHRVISRYLQGESPEELKAHFGKGLEEKATLCSENERRAEAAEREATEIKIAEYMSDKIGQTFEGVIDSITSWGIYVRLNNTAEGMVSYADMTDDHYVADEASISCMGERTHKTYTVGDKVKVVLQRVDVEMRHIDFIFEGTAPKTAIPKISEPKAPKTSKARKRKTKARTKANRTRKRR
ncbi:MAG: ribonuclease R [Clostridiales bacterium]|nr:ribonuclease R [Clostridiales bacterium]